MTSRTDPQRVIINHNRRLFYCWSWAVVLGAPTGEARAPGRLFRPGLPADVRAGVAASADGGSLPRG